MNGKTNENVFVKAYEFDKPPIQKIDCIIDDCIRDCRHKYFHTFHHICVYDIKLTNIGNNEIVDLTISDKSMGFYEINKKLTVDRQNGFIFNQINKLTIKNCSHVRYINISYHLKLRIPIIHGQFFKKLSHNHDYVQTHCMNLNNRLHFAFREWYLYTNRQC